MQINEEVQASEKLEDIIRICNIYVPVSDIYKAIEWYETNLGCKFTGDKTEPNMTGAFLNFPDRNVPTLFLHKSDEEGGRLGFSWSEDSGKPHAVVCFVTPRIQELFERFKKNGVNIVGQRQTCGPNITFSDPDGNLWEVWQP